MTPDKIKARFLEFLMQCTPLVASSAEKYVGEIAKCDEYLKRAIPGFASCFAMTSAEDIDRLIAVLNSDTDFSEKDKNVWGRMYSTALEWYKRFVNALHLAHDWSGMTLPPATLSKSARQIIYYGAPGTGKSHTVNSIIKGDADNYQRVTFHPDTDYASFVGCYKPTKEEACDKLTYAFVAQPFLKAYIEAWKRHAALHATIGENVSAAVEPEPYFLIIEEINRGNCAQIFGDVFQLLDRDDNEVSKYPITPDTDITQYLARAFEGLKLPAQYAEIVSGEKMRLPSNLFIYATMNTSDQSLFPIDSAFKRRWDWKYTPITNGGKGYVIAIDGIGYDWYEFISTINKRIYECTNSEDKQMGYWFVHLPKHETLISQSTFISKVLFYLWSDVFKDFGRGGNNIFQGEDVDGKITALPFHDFFEGNVAQKIHDFMRYNKIERVPLDEKSDEGESSDTEDSSLEDSGIGDSGETDGRKKNKYTFSVNGTVVTSMPGVVRTALNIYIDNHPELSADEIVEAWKALDIDNVANFIETEAEYEARKKTSTDTHFSSKANLIRSKKGDVLYVSNQYGTDKNNGTKNIDRVIERINKQEWGIDIYEITD